MTDVFISYQHGERDAVAIIAQRLIELRVAVWFDSALKPGGVFDEEIARKLAGAKAVLTCWTPAAMASDWVRAEAALARESDKLVACLLEPVQLMPPFNLIHAENLTTWAGQEDDPGWLKVLGRIGELCGRPGLAGYTQAMRSTAPLDALRAWATSYGDDPLADTAWERLRALEGEDQAGRIARERAEAETEGRRRRAQTQRSLELAKARGIRNGGADRTLLRRVVVSVAVVAALSVAGIGYLVDAQRRGRALDAATTPEQLYAFIDAQQWHPAAGDAKRRLALSDAAAWAEARTLGSLTAMDGYIKRFSRDPVGAHLDEAYAARKRALGRIEVQRRLVRLGLYAGETDGATSAALREAIENFQYGALLQVNGDAADPKLPAALDQRIADRIGTRPAQLKAARAGAPTLDDYRRIAARLRIDALVLPAIQDVESKGRGFDANGRPLIRFETHIFSRQTKGDFDAAHPEVSNRKVAAFGGQPAEWQHLNEAFALAPQEAYESTSIGMFGVMGLHAVNLGFGTPAEMARFVSESEANQVEVFARFLEIDGRGALQAVRTPNWTGFEPADWETFARAYNGAGYRAFHYHEKLALAYRRAAERLGIPLPSALSAITDPAAKQAQPRTAAAAPRGRPIEVPVLGAESAPMAPVFALVGLLVFATLAAAIAHVRHRRC